jgi:hypothetical protein
MKTEMTPEEESFLPPEYTPNVLVVMARGNADGLWRAAGGAVVAGDLAIPDSLADRLRHWSRDFIEAIRDEGDPGRKTALAAFTAEGLAIACEVQAALGPAYRILFFDEAKLEADAYLTDYLYPAQSLSAPA